MSSHLQSTIAKAVSFPLRHHWNDDFSSSSFFPYVVCVLCSCYLTLCTWTCCPAANGCRCAPQCVGLCPGLQESRFACQTCRKGARQSCNPDHPVREILAFCQVVVCERFSLPDLHPAGEAYTHAHTSAVL